MSQPLGVSALVGLMQVRVSLPTKCERFNVWE